MNEKGLSNVVREKVKDIVFNDFDYVFGSPEERDDIETIVLNALDDLTFHEILAALVEDNNGEIEDLIYLLEDIKEEREKQNV